MTGEGEITMLQEHLATCRRLDDRLRTIRGRLDGQVNSAWEKSETLFETKLAIERFVERERLLHGDL